jgi:hypothetical protein
MHQVVAHNDLWQKKDIKNFESEDLTILYL